MWLHETNANAVKNGLSCTDLCSCYDEEDELCQDMFSEELDDDESNE